MKISTFIIYASFLALGALTSFLGYHIATWQFWAFMVVFLVGISAAQTESAR